MGPVWGNLTPSPLGWGNHWVRRFPGSMASSSQSCPQPVSLYLLQRAHPPPAVELTLLSPPSHAHTPTFPEVD